MQVASEKYIKKAVMIRLHRYVSFILLDDAVAMAY